MIEISHTLRRRFVKDMGLPINLVRDPYFWNFLDVLDSKYDTREKYNIFINLVKKLGSEEAFFQESKRIIESAMESISDADEYWKFGNSEHLDIDKENLPSNINLYNGKSDDKSFLSIDIKQANFNIMKLFSPFCFNEEKEFDTYEDFIKMFTDEEYFLKSKHIRQVIFGNRNPKMQQLKQKEFLAQVSKFIKDKCSYINEIYRVNSDELLIECSVETSKKIIEVINTYEHSDILKCEFFTLRHIENTKFYYHEYTDSRKKLKCVPATVYMQVYKVICLHENPTHDDLAFFHDGMLAHYDKPILTID